jgi:ferric iron reductase protein FhuF
MKNIFSTFNYLIPIIRILSPKGIMRLLAKGSIWSSWYLGLFVIPFLKSIELYLRLHTLSG